MTAVDFWGPAHRIEIRRDALCLDRLAFTADGATLVVSSFGGERRLTAWSTRSWSMRWSAVLPSQLFDLAVDQHHAFTTHDGPMRVWSLGHGRPAGELADGAAQTKLVAALPGGRILATAHRDPALPATQLVMWDAARRVAFRGAEHASYVTRWTVAGDRVATHEHDRQNGHQLALIDLGSGDKTPLIRPSAYSYLSFLPGGQHLLVIGTDEAGFSPLVIETPTGNSLARLDDAGLTWTQAMALSPSGRWLATSHGEQPDNHAPYDDLCVRIWDLESGAVVGRLVDGLREPLLQLAFSPDGRLLAGTSGTNVILTWDVLNPA